MRCWRVTSFFVSLRAVLHMSLSAGLAHLSLEGCRQLNADVGSQVTHKHTSPDPLFLEPEDCYKMTTHWYSLCLPSVAVMVLRRSVLQKDDILRELYADTRSDVSDYSDNESLCSDNDISTTSSRKQLRSSTGPLTPHFPHPFFLTSVKTIFITVWD